MRPYWTSALMMAMAATVSDQGLSMGANLTLVETQAVLAASQTESDSDGLVEGFPADTWTLQSYGSVTFGDDAGESYLAHFGGGYHFFENVSINFELFGGGFHADDQGISAGQDGAVAGLDLLLRWHYGFGNCWTVYMGGGAGIWQGTSSFPAAGTHFNFTPQFGVGITFNFNESMRLMAGTRWHHISNAGIDGEGNNSGHDGAMVYAGVMFAY